VQLSENGARLYEIGRYYWNQRTANGVGKSLQYFAQVIDSDPNSALGYAALAEANAMMGDYEYGSAKPSTYFDRAKEYANKALALDPNSAEAHAVLGLIALDKKQMSTATKELERAIALDPSYGPAREWYGITLLGKGKIRDGFGQLRAAADLDPLSVAATAWLGSAAYFNRRFGDAIAYSRQALELSPQRYEVLSTIGEAYEAQGDYNLAIDSYKKLGAASGDYRAESAALLAHVYAVQHNMTAAREQLGYARAHARDVNPADLALAAAAVGDRSIALGVLKHSKSHAWIAVQFDPRFDELRNQREFKLLAQVES
jgi:tetratricopeptide (TPR) repeat protein